MGATFAARALPLIRTVVHCDWLDQGEVVELAQELTTAETGEQIDAIMARWNLDFNGMRLIDLTGEIA